MLFFVKGNFQEPLAFFKTFLIYSKPMKNNLENYIQKQGIGVLDLLSRIEQATGKSLNWHTLKAAREGRPVNTRTHESIAKALGLEVRICYGEIDESTKFNDPQNSGEPSEAWKRRVLVSIARLLGLSSMVQDAIKPNQNPPKQETPNP